MPRRKSSAVLFRAAQLPDKLWGPRELRLAWKGVVSRLGNSLVARWFLMDLSPPMLLGWLGEEMSLGGPPSVA